jgi:hypothetical protein
MTPPETLINQVRWLVGQLLTSSSFILNNFLMVKGELTGQFVDNFTFESTKPQKLSPHQPDASPQGTLSMVALIMTSVLSSSPMPRMLLNSLTVAFTHSCSSLGPDSIAASTMLYPNSLFTLHVSINLSCLRFCFRCFHFHLCDYFA